MHDDEELTPDERAAFDRLPRTEVPAPAFEDRVVADLRARGEIQPASPRRPWLWQAAAALLLLAGGFAAGRLTTPLAPPPPAANTAGAQEFLLLLYGAGTTSPEDARARYAEYGNWARTEASAGRLISGARLGPAQVALGDAQFAPPATLQPSGYFVIRATSFDEAAATAARCPHVSHGGTVVIKAIE